MKIAFSGKMGSGKDTAATMLAYIHMRCKTGVPATLDGYHQYMLLFENKNYLMFRGDNSQFTEMLAFADPLKAHCAAFSGLPLETFYTEDGKNQPYKGKMVRDMIIEVSAHIRSTHPNIWIDRTVEALFKSNKGLRIITDVRFLDEYLRCKKEGYIIIRIERDGALIYKDWQNNTEGSMIFDALYPWAVNPHYRVPDSKWEQNISPIECALDYMTFDAVVGIRNEGYNELWNSMNILYDDYMSRNFDHFILKPDYQYLVIP